MTTTPAADLVAYIISTHHDHVWARLPFLPAMAARVERARGPSRRPLQRLVGDLRALLFAHLEREDRVLLALARSPAPPGTGERAARLHQEHAAVAHLLDLIRDEVGDGFRPAADAGPAEHALCEELRELDRHVREQIRLEEALITAG